MAAEKFMMRLFFCLIYPILPLLLLSVVSSSFSRLFLALGIFQYLYYTPQMSRLIIYYSKTSSLNFHKYCNDVMIPGFSELKTIFHNFGPMCP